MPVADEQQDKEDGDQHHSHAGEHVGDVRDTGARNHRIDIWLARHRNRISVAETVTLARVTGAPARVVVRRARTSDVPAMKALVDIYSGKILLEKNLVNLYEAVQEFWVGELDGEIVGCGALHVLWADLGEVRTVAVHPKVRGKGVGHRVV